jgi:ABC-type phosphate transport system substrate-binding protein
MELPGTEIIVQFLMTGAGKPDCGAGMNLKQCIFIVVLIVALAAKTLAADFVVVVHSENALFWMTEQDLKQIFLGKKTTWPDRRTIDIIIQEDSVAHAGFTQEVLGKTSQQFMVYWKKMLFTGKGLLPRSARNDAEVKAFVASKPEAIGYLSPEALDSTVKKLEIR